MFFTQYNEKEKLWSGKKCPTIYNPKASMGSIILHALNRNPEKVIQVSDDTGIEVSSAEIRLKTIRAAQNLQRLGYKSNDVFGFMVGNIQNLSPIVFAAFCLGCPINALDPAHDKSQVVHMFGITKPKVIFCEEACFDTLKSGLDELGSKAKVFIFDGNRDNTACVDGLFLETGSESEFM